MEDDGGEDGRMEGRSAATRQQSSVHVVVVAPAI
jgi:hypothetical protein